MSCQPPAGGKQHPAGVLHLIFRISPLEKKKQKVQILKGFGTSVEIRNTMEPMRSSPHRASVHRTLALNFPNLSAGKEKSRKSKCSFCFFGPSVEIRTRGLLNPIQARYQTSPHPDILLRLSAKVYYHNFYRKSSIIFPNDNKRLFPQLFIRKTAVHFL